MESEIARMYGNRLRIRVCGLCWTGDSLLMINHKLKDNDDFWAPPGGGLEYGQTLAETLVREFREEANMDISPGQFRFGCEFISPPLHALELFFDVTANSNTVKTGYDPELQIIKDARFLTPGEIAGMPSENLHGIFQITKKIEDLKALKGFYTL